MVLNQVKRVVKLRYKFLYFYLQIREIRKYRVFWVSDQQAAFCSPGCITIVLSVLIYTNMELANARVICTVSLHGDTVE